MSELREIMHLVLIPDRNGDKVHMTLGVEGCPVSVHNFCVWYQRVCKHFVSGSTRMIRCSYGDEK